MIKSLGEDIAMLIIILLFTCTVANVDSNLSFFIAKIAGLFIAWSLLSFLIQRK